jgi:hypothetical protein
MALFVNDTFTDTNGTLITAHTGELGATWLKHLSANNGAPPTIENNAVRAAENNSEAWYYASGVATTPDYPMTTRYSVLAVSNGNSAGAGVRHSTSASTGYQFTYNSNFGAPFFRLRKVVAGVVTSLVGDLTFAGLGIGTYDITCSAVGTTISGFVQQVPGNLWLNPSGAWQAAKVACMTAADSAITAAGRAAVMIARRNAAEEETLSVFADDPATGTPAPVLSAPTAGTPATTSITISATSDRASDGTMRFLRRVGGSAASAATLVSAGESQAATANPQSRAMTGFTAGSANNFVDILQVGAGGNSNVVSVGPFTMASGAATALTLSGPSTGVNGQASTNFTVGANGAITGTVVVTPDSGGGGGSFTPATVNLTSGTPTATFTYTPASTGAKSIGVTNNASLTAPAPVTYTVTTAPATQIVLPLVGAPNLTNLDYAVWAQTRTRDLVAPIVKGSTAAISGASCTLSITGLGILQGAVCWVEINNSDGTVVQATMFGYSGPAVAS